MGKTVVKPWVKVAGVMIVVAAIVFGLYSLGQKGDSKSFEIDCSSAVNSSNLAL